MTVKLYVERADELAALVTVLATTEQVETMIADPRVQGVSVTGSERAAVASAAGRALKKVVLALGARTRTSSSRTWGWSGSTPPREAAPMASTSSSTRS